MLEVTLSPTYFPSSVSVSVSIEALKELAASSVGTLDSIPDGNHGLKVGQWIPWHPSGWAWNLRGAILCIYGIVDTLYCPKLSPKIPASNPKVKTADSFPCLS